MIYRTKDIHTEIKQGFFCKLKELLCQLDEWDFDDNNENNMTKNAYLTLLEDFRPDTPLFIKNLFKKCVRQNKDARPNFEEIRKLLADK